MSLEPVPQMMVAPSPTSSRTASSSLSFSSSDRVGASPVVPATTSPCEPFSTRWRASRRAAPRSSAPSASNGVTIAVITPEIVVIVPRRKVSRKDRQVAVKQWCGLSGGDGGRRPVGPRTGLLELGGDAEQHVLLAEARHELDPDRQAVIAPMERKRDRGLARDVEDRGEGRRLCPPHQRRHGIVPGVVEASERGRRLAQGRREQQVESGLVPARDHPRDELMLADRGEVAPRVSPPPLLG